MFHIRNFFFFLFIFPLLFYGSRTYKKYTKDDLNRYREEVREMFNHAYNGYLKYAYPYDELRPLTCDGVDTWGSYSLTLIDVLDTLIIMGNYSEFQRVVNIITETINFDANTNVSVFETNIRVVGGLLSAHILSHKAGMSLEAGWPCNGPLLRLAANVANRLLPAFDTTTGMPYGTVNLKYGVPKDETTITCTAAIGTFMLEFGTLSRLTGDPVYEEVATNALRSLFQYQSKIGLLGNHVDIQTGVWTAQDSGIGAGIDSYFEYLVKGALLFNKPELLSMFSILEKSVNQYLRHNNWFFWASMQKGLITLPLFQSLEAYWPGVLSHIGNMNESMKSIHNYHTVWKRYGFTPEFYNILHHEVSSNRESYPLRPELIESVMYLYRISGDPYLLDIGVDILKSIQHSAKTSCGYATIKDCRDHSLENRMESFFLAETTKYLYLLFDPDNFIHNRGEHGRLFKAEGGKECVIDAGGYLFNTEAHPIDSGIFRCCSNDVETNAFKVIKKTEKNAQRLIKTIDDLEKFENVDTELKSEIFNELKDIRKLIKRSENMTTKKLNICSLYDWKHYVFSNVEHENSFKIENRIAASENEDIRLLKQYLMNKTEYTDDLYDVQYTLEKILKERNQDTDGSFTDFNLLNCKPQHYIQRLSFYGQFYDGL